MDSGNTALRVFHIPESLDYRNLLRPPGQDDADRLDASEADDPESWSSVDAEAALNTVNAATSRTPQDTLELLTREVFCNAFNLSRHFANIQRQLQTSVAQSFVAMCSRVHDILEKVPPSPYFSSSEAASNKSYLEVETKVVALRSGNGLANDSCEADALMVKPSDMGQVLRSLCHMCVFLVCTTFRCSLATQKDNDKTAFPADISATKRSKSGRGGVRRKKTEEDGNVNTVALELLVDAMLIITRIKLRVPFSGEYGGMGRPDPPLLRLLLDTLMLAMGSPVATSNNEKLVDATSRLIDLNYRIMQDRLDVSRDKRPMETNSDDENDASNTSPLMSSRTVDSCADAAATTTDAERVDAEWLVTLSEEVKKGHSVMIADALAILQELDIPTLVVKEILLSVRDGFVLQVSGGTVQLMSWSIQTEYANVGSFVERVARKFPSAIVRCLDELRYMFDVPSYNLRKSIMESVKLLIIMAKNEEDDMTEDNTSDHYASPTDAVLCARHRERMLQLMISRQYDAYMYARAALLKAFQDLIESEALPVRWFVQTAALAIARLLDRGSQVRQRALNLLTTLVHDATKKRFKVPLNTETVNKDLSMMHSLVAKLDTISTLESNGKASIGQYEEYPGVLGIGSQEDGDPLKEQASVDTNTEVNEHSESQDVEHKKQTLLDELNSELGDSISLGDNDALGKLRTRLEIAREMYSDVHDISEKVETSIVICADLLQSSVEGDQRAAIRYLATCHLMGVTSASALLPKVWALSWSNNQNVVDTVLQEFKNVYFADGDDTAIAWRLVQLLSSSRLTAFASIEKIFEVSMAREQPYFAHLDRLMVALLRIALAPNYQLGRDTNPRVALGVVRLLLNSSMRSRSPQAQSIRQFDEKRISAICGLLQLSSGQSSTIFGELCLILAAAMPSKHVEDAAAHILKLFIGTFGSMDDAWFRMAQCVVDVTFIHSKFPEMVWSQILNELLDSVTNVTENKNSTARQLAQVIFLAGHVAIRTIISMDRLQSDLKSARSELESLDGGKYNNDASNQMGVATSEEQERELFEQLCEGNIVCANLLGGPGRNLIVACLRNPQKLLKSNTKGVRREIEVLKTCAAIALCKFATVSKLFCNSVFHPEDGIPAPCSVIEVIISLLMNKRLAPGYDTKGLTSTGHNYYYLPEPSGGALRATLLMSYGDLLCRHPNLLEPWNDEVCAILLDRDDSVREAAVLVFTHLVMNDMVKPRGKLVDAMMYLTLDPHVKVANCARTFFHEVHRKNPNTIYNCFPEMVATLARNRRRQSIQRNLAVLQMLLKFIRRDKQGESIVEKVCLRLHSTEPTNRPALVMYGHVLINVCQNEKCMAKLIASIPSISRLIVESDYFLATILLVCKRAKSGNQGRRSADNERPPDGSADGADMSQTNPSVSSGTATGENASIKDLAEELIMRVHGLFGEGKSSHVNQTATSAESIIASAEASSPGEDEESCANNLFISDFGLVTAESLPALSDDECESYATQAAAPSLTAN
ncbi:Condensin complex subunit 1 [Babesia sp. Xinjiang]|uniref:Condensin complex subunit 1 n=1 Tax=Babesia sp. Xinjiang TaxID=462227 RepID=UPI000A228A86|nr:Condensin complex subunit 1 [Babesia sp. Xinjiang]ORM41396.1 Condensin complex subunit 1 [Babesia sp. Xinjiang]